jgi:hypothetical protein
MNGMGTLWFFWGQKHMTFLRWLTLYSARRIHNDVRLVIRSTPVAPTVGWIERQDFQYGLPKVDWMPKVADLDIEIIELEDIASEVAALNMPDTHTSDLLGFYLLAEFGGTVADMDIVFLKPLPTIRNDLQLVVFSGHPKPGCIPVGFMQGRPCTRWGEIYRGARDSYHIEEYESCGAKHLPPDTVPTLSEHVVFPWAGPHPWSLWRRWFFVARTWPPIPDDCIGLHWYGSHAQQWNQSFISPRDVQHGAMGWAVKQIMPHECDTHKKSPKRTWSVLRHSDGTPNPVRVQNRRVAPHPVRVQNWRVAPPYIQDGTPL